MPDEKPGAADPDVIVPVPDERAPLGDRELTRAWLARFHQTGPGRQRQELLALLRAARAAPQYSEKYLDTLMDVAQAWHTIAAKLSRTFRRNPPAVTDNPGQFHAEMAELNMAFGDIYAGFVDAMGTGATPKGPPATPLLLSTGLALYHYGKGAKFLYCKTELPSARFWQRVHAMYELAVSRGFADERLALFPIEEVIATCSEYWLRILMLATISTGNFTSRQLDRTDEWLETWCARISVDSNFDESKHVYFVDLAHPHEPRRITPQLKLVRALYVCTKHLHQDIIAARTQLVQDLMISSIGWYADNPLKDYFELLDRLKRIWVSAPSVISGRNSARNTVPKGERIELVRGFAEILALFAPDRAAKPRIEAFAVIDRSDSGYGMFAPIDQRPPPGHMELVAVRQPDAAEWQIYAVVRTTVLPGNRGHSVGLHLLAQTAVLVSLGDASAESGAEPGGGESAEGPGPHERLAFYLVGDTQKNHADSLLAPSGVYEPGHRLTLETASNVFLIRVNRVIQTGKGWERTGFQVVEKTM